jgi:hypothetical protein
MKGKIIKNDVKTVCLVLVFLTTYTASMSQNKTQKQNLEIQNLLQQKEYVFKAEYAMPSIGPSRYLNADYDVVISKDTLNSYLPYIGRVYSAPFDPRDLGLDFVSTQFEYKSEPAKKDSWNIMITPHDAKDVRQLTLNVFNNGTASLHVISDNRQPIVYSGYITKRDKK